MKILTSKSSLEFPPRRNSVQADWAPVYIEPMMGSGEKICIGIAVANAGGFLVTPVVALKRLSSIYGKEAEALVFAANLAIEHFQNHLIGNGQDGIRNWKPPLDGIILGSPRIGAGMSLEEIARTGLMACASLVEKLSEEEENIQAVEGITTNRLEQLVKQRVIALNPGLERSFNLKRQLKENARASEIGFVGKKLAANFGILVPASLGLLVNIAKAKLWDLAQLREDLNKEALFNSELQRFEMLLHRVKYDAPEYNERQVKNVQYAVNELEAEADKMEIRCRDLISPDDIANEIILAEAA